MNDGINKLTQYVKTVMETQNKNGFLICLEENCIKVKNSDWSTETIEFEEGNNIGIENFICLVTDNIIKEFDIKDIFSVIKAQSFAGYKDVLSKGPIQFVVELDDNRGFSLSYTSTVEKYENWLLDYVKYVDSRNNNKNNEELEAFSNYIEKIENECLEKQNNSEIKR